MVNAGMHGGLRASGPKADIALIVAESGAAAAGAFTTNIMCAAPVTYCREVLAKSSQAKAVSRHLPRIAKQKGPPYPNVLSGSTSA